MRGGTLLHKVHLAPASRYSEDIDLVVIGDRPDEHVRKAINHVLLNVLGRPTSSAWQAVKLAVRNAVKPSKVLRVIYRVPSVVPCAGTIGVFRRSQLAGEIDRQQAGSYKNFFLRP